MPIPSSIDAERALLGVLIIKNLPWPEKIRPAHFADPSLADIAHVIEQMTNEGIAPNDISVTERLRAMGSPVDGQFLNALTVEHELRAYSATWEDSIIRAHKLRKIQEIARKISQHAEDSSSDPDALLAYAEGQLGTIGRLRNNGPQAMSLADLENFKREADPTNVLGNRWLCKGGSLVMAGQAGTGKSALMMQAAINWTLGKDFFGIATEGGMKMRTLVIQAENDAGDVAESMQDQIHSLGLSQDERAELKERLHIYREAVATGAEFGRVLKKLVIEHQATIAFVDPLMAYVGADISEAAEAAKFLRHIIQPILNETGVIIVFMHHTGKPKSAKDKEGQTAADLAYNLFGSSEVTNWAREIACLMRCPGDEQIYRFGLTKRRGRAGMTDINGDKAGEIYIQHSPNRGEIRWVRSNPPITYDQMGS